ncbi:TSUP family transporter [Streptomyces sp. SM13]|uniref:TSUP family transporter n=1 Tax=Streptomyces sp. SM13 TaxID=1983803 RepID=UPI0027E5A566|nr:TSUP family transporter [Streptomyces sp. SM13]
MIIVTATSATALYTHARDGHVAWKAGTLFAAAGVVPAFLVGTTAAHVPETALTAAFAAIAALAALRDAEPIMPLACGPPGFGGKPVLVMSAQPGLPRGATLLSASA